MDWMESCTLCPRMCRADRRQSAGFCKMGACIRAARAAPHLWEEPPISGTRGTGAVFFSGCTLRCVYCQNADISVHDFGCDITPVQLGDILLRLQEERVQTLSLISPTPFVPLIIEALERVRSRLVLPVVYNTGGYENVSTLRLLDGLIDVYLPDLKVRSPELAARYSAAPDYFEAASSAICEMVRQTGAPQYSAEGILLRGTLVRHLVLPGGFRDSMAVLDWLAQTFPEGSILFSLMNQYTPDFVRGDFPELRRRVTSFEYRRVLKHAQKLGLAGYCQDRSAADAQYTPNFDLTGIQPMK